MNEDEIVERLKGLKYTTDKLGFRTYHIQESDLKEIIDAVLELEEERINLYKENGLYGY